MAKKGECESCGAVASLVRVTGQRTGEKADLCIFCAAADGTARRAVGELSERRAGSGELEILRGISRMLHAADLGKKP